LWTGSLYDGCAQYPAKLNRTNSVATGTYGMKRPDIGLEYGICHGLQGGPS